MLDCRMFSLWLILCTLLYVQHVASLSNASKLTHQHKHTKWQLRLSRNYTLWLPILTTLVLLHVLLCYSIQIPVGCKSLILTGSYVLINISNSTALFGNFLWSSQLLKYACALSFCVISCCSI